MFNQVTGEASGDEGAKDVSLGSRRMWIRDGLIILVAVGGIVAWGLTKSPPRPAGAQDPARDVTEIYASELRNRFAAGLKDPFDVSNATVPQDRILVGGPGRDGVPALLEPRFEPASAASYLQNEDIVLGLEINGEARAYPLRILVWHEIANDEVGGVPVVATYFPLCGTAMAFRREVAGQVRTFGESGLLYNSNLLMYDHQTESLWSQLKMEAIAGPSAGERLEWIPAAQTTWRSWREQYPDSKVLSDWTGFLRNYGRSPYEGYERNEEILSPVPMTRTELQNKDWVAGVIVAGVAKAYPVSRLADGESPDTIAQRAVRVQADGAARRVHIVDSVTGEEIPSVQAYWFAWQAFYPDTLLYSD